MPTIQELAKNFVLDLRFASDTKQTLKQIFEKIDGLTYPETNKPIANEEKKKIVELMIWKVKDDTVIKETDEDRENIDMLYKYLEKFDDLK